MAQIADDGVGKTVEDMGARRIGSPPVVLGDRIGDRRFELLMQMRLEIRVTLEAELLDHADDGGRRDAGVFGNRGDAAQP